MSDMQTEPVFVVCPECQVHMPVRATVHLDGAAGEQVISFEPDLTDMWAHVWSHS